MDPRIANPFEWADVGGALVFYGIMAVILLGVGLKLLGTEWDDWLDSRWGRGSIRDYWLLNETEREARRADRSR